MGGAFAPVAAVTSSHQGLPVGCLWFTHDLSTAAQKPSAWAWQGRKGKEITYGRRDARDLTYSAVIPTRVMQPGVSTRGKQNWSIALCGYGMTLAPRHRVHLLCVASLAYLRWAHRLGCSLAGLCRRMRVGLATGPPCELGLLAREGKSLQFLFPPEEVRIQELVFGLISGGKLHAPARISDARMELRSHQRLRSLARSRREKPKAAPAPNRGSGAGTGVSDVEVAIA